LARQHIFHFLLSSKGGADNLRLTVLLVGAIEINGLGFMQLVEQRFCICRLFGSAGLGMLPRVFWAVLLAWLLLCPALGTAFGHHLLLVLTLQAAALRVTE
jgi:hypothetical protein